MGINMIKRKKQSMLSHIMEGPLKWYDYVLFLLIAMGCFLVFQQGDLLHTAGCSYGYLNGHILDFYDYNNSFGIHPSYLPSTYILFAIWNIPMRILGIVTVPTEQLPLLAVMWAKLFPCLLYLASGYIIYMICMEIGMKSKKSKICMYASLTMPIGFYAQFIFGQYDIFMVFCILLGFYYYLKNENFKFILWFGFAITFKYSALLIFIPLVLLKIKDIWKIIIHCILVAIPYVIEYALYLQSPTFRDYAFGVGSKGDTPTGYIFEAGLFTGYQLGANEYTISLVILVFGLICGMAYFNKIEEKKEQIKWSFYLISLVFFALYGLCKWHPQWLLMAVPFWTMGAFIHKDTKIFMIVDIVFMLLFVSFSVAMIPGNVDQAMLDNGILKSLFEGRFGLPVYFSGNIGVELTMADLLPISPSMSISMISLIMLVYGIFRHPKYCALDFSESVDSCMGWIRARFLLGVSIFVVPAFLCMLAYFLPPHRVFGTPGTSGYVYEIADGAEVYQLFESRGTSIEKIQFWIMTEAQANDGTFFVEIKDHNTGELLYSEELDPSSWYDNQLITCKPKIEVEEGNYYRIVFRLEDGGEDNKLALRNCNLDWTDNVEEKAYVDGKPMDYDIDMNIYQ